MRATPQLKLSARRGFVLVARRTDFDARFVYPFQVRRPAVPCDLNSDSVWAVEVLGTGDGRNCVYRVQHRSGFIQDVSRPNWRGGMVLDRYERTTAGVGFLGVDVLMSIRTHTLWRNMLLRCYDPTHPNYHQYGAKGVTVSPIWHSLEVFAKTLPRVPGYTRWRRGERRQLDKDYYGSDVYAPSTCLFLAPSVNRDIRGDGRLLSVRRKLYASYSEALGNEKNGWYAKSRWDAGFPYRGIHPTEVRWADPPPGMLWRRVLPPEAP